MEGQLWQCSAVPPSRRHSRASGKAGGSGSRGWVPSRHASIRAAALPTRQTVSLPIRDWQEWSGRDSSHGSPRLLRAPADMNLQTGPAARESGLDETPVTWRRRQASQQTKLHSRILRAALSNRANSWLIKLLCSPLIYSSADWVPFHGRTSSTIDEYVLGGRSPAPHSVEHDRIGTGLHGELRVETGRVASILM